MPVPGPRRRPARAGLLSRRSILSRRIIRPTVRDPPLRAAARPPRRPTPSAGRPAPSRCGVFLPTATTRVRLPWHCSRCAGRRRRRCSARCWGWRGPPGSQRALTLGYLAAAVAAASLANAGSLAGLGAAAVGYGVSRALTGPAAAALPPRIVAGRTCWPPTRSWGPPARRARSSARRGQREPAVAGFGRIPARRGQLPGGACAVAMLPSPRSRRGRPARSERHPGRLASLRAGLQVRFVAASRRPGGSRGRVLQRPGRRSDGPGAARRPSQGAGPAGVAVAAGLVVPPAGSRDGGGRDC